MRLRDTRTGTILSTDDETAKRLLDFHEYEEVKDEKPAAKKTTAAKTEEK